MKIIKKEEFLKLGIIKDMENIINDFNKLWNKKGEGIYCINFGSRWDVEIYYVENLSNELENIFSYIKEYFEDYIEENDKKGLFNIVKESIEEELGLFEFLNFVNEDENEEGKLYMDLNIGEEDIRNYFIIKE